jgi:hypothetical protein
MFLHAKVELILVTPGNIHHALAVSDKSGEI